MNDITKGVAQRKWAMAKLMQIIETSEASEKVNGKCFSQADIDRYSKVALLCIALFKSGPTNAKITIDESMPERSFAGVAVYADAFGLHAGNKDNFAELISLADEIIFYGDGENYFHATFYVTA